MAAEIGLKGRRRIDSSLPGHEDSARNPTRRANEADLHWVRLYSNVGCWTRSGLRTVPAASAKIKNSARYCHIRTNPPAFRLQAPP